MLLDTATSTDPFSLLNDQQRAAVEHGIGPNASDARPLLIIAGAGSGKTNTLAHRVAKLIQHGADPQRILLLTFSRRAAAEMERRVGTVLTRVFGSNVEGTKLPWSGTFHSIGARLLREYATAIGLDDSFTIHDRTDAEDLMGIVRHDIGLSSTKERIPMKGTCLSIYSRVVNTREALADVLRSTFPWCAQWESELKRLFSAYVEAKQAQNVVDYDDLLLFWAEMMREPELAQHVGVRFDHVLVDEYQDTNRLQAEILISMKPDGKGVTVVGDDAQSIYSFRGATVRNILDFPRQFSREAHIVALERNYRSTQSILDASNAVINAALERHAKTLWTDKKSDAKPQLVVIPDEAEQARWIAGKVLEYRETGMTLKSQAVLFRTAAHSAALELELARRNIPFVKFGGLKFLESSHVKDLLAILRFAQNPLGRTAGFRSVQLIPGIGPATATRLLDAISEATDPQEVMNRFTPPTAASTDWKIFVDTYCQLRNPHIAWPADLESAKAWYVPLMERLYDDAPIRMNDIEQLARLATGYGSRELFLAELTLDPPAATSDESGPPNLDEDYLILSTIHSAKGQEWKSVFVLNVADGCIPSDMSTGSSDEIEEERRLLYVAMTRAKEHLHLMVPHKFYVRQQTNFGDKHVYAGRSRFISKAMESKFECIAWLREPGAGVGKNSLGMASIQIRARAKNLWA